MQLFYPVQHIRGHVEWKKVALRAYLCWSVCVDMAALAGILWYIFK